MKALYGWLSYWTLALNCKTQDFLFGKMLCLSWYAFNFKKCSDGKASVQPKSLLLSLECCSEILLPNLNLYVALTWVYEGFWVCPCLAGLCRAADSLPHNVSSIPWSSPFVQVGIQPSPSYWTVLNRACVPWLKKKNLWFIFISSLRKWHPSLSSFHLCLGVCDFCQWENCNFLLQEGPTWEVYHIVREAQRISLAHSCWTSTGSSRFLSLRSQPSEISISS